MSANPPFRKVFAGVATREQMFRLFNHHEDNPDFDPLSGKPYSGEWFEIEAASYDLMLGLLPPLFQRTGMFGISEYKAGNVTSVFFELRIRARQRWFHGFCDLSDKRSPDVMRAAIIAHETSAFDSMTREEKLEVVWNAMPSDFKGVAGSLNPQAWPPHQRGKRTILVDAGGPGMFMTLLEDLTDEEMNTLLLSVRRRKNSPTGGDDGASS